MLRKSRPTSFAALCSKHNPSAAPNKCWGFECDQVLAAALCFDPDTSSLCVLGSHGGVSLDPWLKLKTAGSTRLSDLLKMSAHHEGSGSELIRRRPKRSVFLHSGVRICPQEGLEEILASHQAYYQLRGTHFYSYDLLDFASPVRTFAVSSQV